MKSTAPFTPWDPSLRWGDEATRFPDSSAPIRGLPLSPERRYAAEQEVKMPDEMKGGCACGRIRYTARVENDEAYLCHCRMCQRSTGGVSIAFKSMKKADVEWEQEPDWYVSSPIARRPYCRECGTSLGFAFPDSENMDLTIGSFDDPRRFRPRHHFGAESMHRAWINTEGLTEYRTDEYEPVAERWIKAVGKLPE